MHYASFYALKPFSETEVINPNKNLSLIDCIITIKDVSHDCYDYGNKVYPNHQSHALFYIQKLLYSDIKGLEPPSTSINTSGRLQRESVGGQHRI